MVPWVLRSLAFPFPVLSLQVERDTELTRVGVPCAVAFRGIFLEGCSRLQLLTLFWKVCNSTYPQESLVLGFLDVPKLKYVKVMVVRGFPGGSDGKESAYNAGDLGSIPGSGRSPGEGNGNPIQYSCLENPTDRGAWRATVLTKSWT